MAHTTYMSVHVCLPLLLIKNVTWLTDNHYFLFYSYIACTENTGLSNNGHVLAPHNSSQEAHESQKPQEGNLYHNTFELNLLSAQQYKNQIIFPPEESQGR